MYYYSDGKNEVGPFDLDRLSRLRESGLIGDVTLVRRSDSTSWAPFTQLLGGDGGAGRGDGDGDGGGHHWKRLPSRPDDGAAPRRAADSTLIGEAGAEAVPAPVAAGPAGWLSHPPAPWRRFAARLVDTTFNGMCGAILLAAPFFAVLPATADSAFAALDSPLGRIVDFIATYVLAALIGGILVGVTGFTLGKLLFGIKVTRPDGGRLGILPGVGRDFLVLLKGLGLAVPIVSLLTMWLAYRRLIREGATSWDKDKHVVWYRPGGVAQHILSFIGVLIFFLLIVVLALLTEL